jgi:hypothetical protein
MDESKANKWLPMNIWAKIAFFILLIDGLQGLIFSGNLIFLLEILLALALSPKVYRKVIK